MSTSKVLIFLTPKSLTLLWVFVSSVNGIIILLGAQSKHVDSSLNFLSIHISTPSLSLTCSTFKLYPKFVSHCLNAKISANEDTIPSCSPAPLGPSSRVLITQCPSCLWPSNNSLYTRINYTWLLGASHPNDLPLAYCWWSDSHTVSSLPQRH